LIKVQDIVSFQKLVNLECLDFCCLDLSINSQEEMKGLFDSFKKLRKIRLYQISRIDQGSFSNLVHLDTLEFYKCDFTPNDMKGGISCNTFSNLDKLNHLDL